MAASATKSSSVLAWFATSMVVLWLLIAVGPFIWTVWGAGVPGDAAYHAGLGLPLAVL